MAGGAAATAVGGLEIAAKTGAAGAALAPAAFGLMVAGGAITAGRGLWKLGKSVKRLSNLSDVNPMTAEGRMWLARAKNRAKNKAAISGFKTVLGGLGIAAGALLLASNPIGWAIGLGAALLGGVATLASLRNKANQVKTDQADKGGMSAEQQVKVADAQRDGAVRERLAAPGEKKKARQATAEATAALHSNLQVGMQIHDALVAGGDDVAAKAAGLGRRYGQDELPFAPAVLRKWTANLPDTPFPSMAAFRAFDALMVCKAMGISKQEAVSPSGAELVQQKLSAADAS